MKEQQVMQAEIFLRFWFEEIPAENWYRKDAAFDQQLRARFGQWHVAATRGELASWRHNIRGRLAEIMLLDQLSRNLFRDSALSFAHDGMALVLAQEAVASGLAETLPPVQRAFLYLPYMHSESAFIHQQALALYQALGEAINLDYEQRHKAIIDRFGRYPHRNAVLGRQSTSEELRFLQEPGSHF